MLRARAISFSSSSSVTLPKAAPDGGLAVSKRDGGELSTGFAYDLVLEKELRTTAEKLRDDIPVEVLGELRKPGVIDCKRIIFRPYWKNSDAFSQRWRGKVQGRRGILRRKGGVWRLQIDEKGRTVKLKIGDGKTEFLECVQMRSAELKPGLRVLWMRGRNYGDLRKAFFVTLAE